MRFIQQGTKRMMNDIFSYPFFPFSLFIIELKQFGALQIIALVVVRVSAEEVPKESTRTGERYSESTVRPTYPPFCQQFLCAFNNSYYSFQISTQIFSDLAKSIQI